MDGALCVIRIRVAAGIEIVQCRAQVFPIGSSVVDPEQFPRPALGFQVSIRGPGFRPTIRSGYSVFGASKSRRSGRLRHRGCDGKCIKLENSDGHRRVGTEPSCSDIH
jgi:hypothetical protein